MTSSSLTHPITDVRGDSFFFLLLLLLLLPLPFFGEWECNLDGGLAGQGKVVEESTFEGETHSKNTLNRNTQHLGGDSFDQGDASQKNC